MACHRGEPVPPAFLQELMGVISRDAFGSSRLSRITEMMLGVAVHRAGVNAGRMWADDERVFYVRTATRKEIDYVSADFGGSAIEAKYTESGRWRSQAATVNASEWDGVLATRNVLDTSGDQAWAVPGAVVAYLIDS